MTRVDFYVLPTTESAERLHFACRIADKAWQNGQNVYLHTSDADAAQILDALLWSFRAESFVPHALAGAEPASPVTIGHTPTHVRLGHDVLINLTQSVPEAFSQYERVIEIVIQEPSALQATRASYKFYQDHGYPLESKPIAAHQLSIAEKRS